MSHDPLCPWDGHPQCYPMDGEEPGLTPCDLIAKVRQDERARALASLQQIMGTDMANMASDAEFQRMFKDREEKP